MNNQKTYDFMIERGAQRDQCMVDLVGNFVQAFIDTFCTTGYNYFEDYEFQGKRYLNVHGTMNENFELWSQWFIDNKVSGSITQEYSDNDFDFYLIENFEGGVYIDYEMDAFCHSEEDEAYALLSECK